MKWGLVSSKALRERSIDIDGHVRRGATIMPFFDSEGRTAFCAVVLPGSSRLYFFIPQEVGPRVPLFGTIRLRRPSWTWSDGAAVISMDHLWHYDPDWLLRVKRFADMEIAADIRKTNCCSQLPSDVQCLYFRRDLSRVRSVLQGKSDNLRLVSIEKVLPTRRIESAESPAIEPRYWRLNPLWTRTGERNETV